MQVNHGVNIEVDCCISVCANDKGDAEIWVCANDDRMRDDDGTFLPLSEMVTELLESHEAQTGAGDGHIDMRKIASAFRAAAERIEAVLDR